MLTELVLTNFKCFKDETHIPLSKLNIFTGTNGSGKSSAIQALLLIAQKDKNNQEYLPLNGVCVNLGSISEIIHRDNVENTPIKIGFKVLDLEYPNVEPTSTLILGRKRRKSLSSYEDIAENLYVEEVYVDFGKRTKVFYNSEAPLAVDSIIVKCDENGLNSDIEFWYKGEHEDTSKFSWVDDIGYNVMSYLYIEATPNLRIPYSSYGIAQQLKFTYYIPADRIGPKSYYLKSPFTSWTDLGLYAEKTLSFILKQRDEVIRNSVMLPQNTVNNYISVISYWLSYIFNDLKINITSERDTIHLTIDGINPTMTGFGYSYVLPIIYTGLAAIKGHTIIIDNPELHLTPKSQSHLMEFLCKVANSGVQVFIETHSDHIINGAQVAVKNYTNNNGEMNGLKNEDISILWFEQNTERSSSTAVPIRIEPNAQINNAPEGFFDQIIIDNEKILGLI